MVVDLSESLMGQIEYNDQRYYGVLEKKHLLYQQILELNLRLNEQDQEDYLANDATVLMAIGKEDDVCQSRIVPLGSLRYTFLEHSSLLTEQVDHFVHQIDGLVYVLLAYHTPPPFPTSSYLLNLCLHSHVKLQGINYS